MAVKIFNVINRGIRVRENGVFTAPELITDAGIFFPEAGGYYAGGNILVNGKEYAVFLAPKESGETTSTQWKTTETSTGSANSTYNGKENMFAIQGAGIQNHPAAEYCYNLDINGFNDWHLPAPDEIEISYRYLKSIDSDNNLTDYSPRPHSPNSNGYNPNSNPLGSEYTLSNPSQTNVTEFIAYGGSQYLNHSGGYWTSMNASTDLAYIQGSNGLQRGFSKTTGFYVRAVRWVEV